MQQQTQAVVQRLLLQSGRAPVLSSASAGVRRSPSVEHAEAIKCSDSSNKAHLAAEGSRVSNGHREPNRPIRSRSSQLNLRGFLFSGL